MRKIDDIEHAPDQRETERHHGVQPAQEDAVDQDLREQIHIVLPVSADGSFAIA